MRALLTVIRLFLILAVAIPLSCIALFSIPFDKKGTAYFWSGSTWSKFSLAICNIKIVVTGRDNIPRDGKYIIVSNHASMFDIPAIMSVFTRTRIMFKKELSYVPLWGWALRYGHHILVDRQKGTEAMKSVDRAVQDIQSGGSVLLFAEGTRSRDGKLQPFKRGAFAIAARSGVPILPLAVNGSFKILPKGSLDIRPSTIVLVIDKPIVTSHINSREGEIELMSGVRDIIAKNYTEQLSQS